MGGSALSEGAESLAMIIHQLTADDVPAVAKAHVRSAQDTYGHYFPAEFMLRNTADNRMQWWADALAEPAPEGSQRRFLVAREAGTVVGIGAFGEARDPDAPADHELWRLYVSADAHGTGLAHRLFRALHPSQTASYLWVMENNPRAIAFYRKLGYAPDGTRVPIPFIADLPKIRMVRPAHDPLLADQGGQGSRI